ncbi:uncharacterized protein LOC107227488 [Neodiprion lecontei]|uniref:Uncharacterized protein LOC107227488 n=1 Tax=Neodiprion lecontei TaxID=441921 RepID=A0A6J0CBU2_NEOLC|nr:uncharacterized protein LOC107227488 [Neodiprion lecontei]
MVLRIYIIAVSCLLVIALPVSNSLVEKNSEENAGNIALAKLVKMFSKPGAFKQIDTLLGENSIEESSTSCPKGDDGLECRRAEARKSVDCPHGDCYCNNCALAGPQMWAPCCRQGLRCCSHLAAACRTCDHPTLYPFCAKHFKKCTNQSNEEKEK